MNDSEISEQLDQLVEATFSTISERRRMPISTYRIQLRGDGFTFASATAVIPYLYELGITHLYCSPYLKARPGSTHGYDIVDHSQLNPELGPEDDYRTFIETLREHDMGHVLDIVPNHMGIACEENSWWQDVLENGPASPYASYFDIDWTPAKKELHNRVLLPFLGDQYGQVLEQGHLRLEYQNGAFHLRCYDWRLPIEPKTYTQILSDCLNAGNTALGAEAECVQELASIIWACENLPDITQTAPEPVLERQREKEIIKTRLDRLAVNEPEIERLIRHQLITFNGDQSKPQSFDALDQLLNRQVYRLAHWKAASDEINYRRFFDINELAALCVEDREVFDSTHDLVLQLLARGDVDGLRIDHVDGLLYPVEYLWRLQRGFVCRLGRHLFESSEWANDVTPVFPASSRIAGSRDLGSATMSPPEPASRGTSPCLQWEALEAGFVQRFEERAASSPWLATTNRDAGQRSERAASQFNSGKPFAFPLYIVVEKILEGEETIPPDWPVAGTTGYGFLNRATELFVDEAGLVKITQAYRQFSGVRTAYEDLVSDCKRLVLRVAMAAELQLLSARLNRLSERHRRTRDFTLNSLRAVLREILAYFPVYRTYISTHSRSSRDRQFVDHAIRSAERMNPTMDKGIFEFVRQSMLLEAPLLQDKQSESDQEMFVGRFQQASSPVMAKGTEDTAFYRFFPLGSLNEVGGSPQPRKLSMSRFHQGNIRRQVTQPGSLTTTTTHDTKRSEDTRARISVLSQIPDRWRKAVSRWARMNRRFVKRVATGPAPSRNDEYLFYQTLIGIWPTTIPDSHERESVISRMQQYMGKAVHEAKVRTSWTNPVTEYDRAICDFVEVVLSPDERNRFLPDFQQFCERVIDAGLYTALSQLFLKLTSPGVPDIYQGQEIWDFTLVDPDNRRPVDYQLRRRLLAEIKGELRKGPQSDAKFVRRLGKSPRDPRLKLFVTWRTLQFRAQSQHLFSDGEYLPLRAEGPLSEHICAFAWRGGDRQASNRTGLAMVIAPRLIATLTASDSDEDDSPSLMGADVWKETALVVDGIEPCTLTDVFTSARYPSGWNKLNLSEVLSDFPLALLTG